MNRLKLCAAILLAGTLLLTGLYRCRQLAPALPSGDSAVLEIFTLQALHGNQLLGPYSRFEWDNPGPLYFYLLAPLYFLSGMRSWSLELSSTLISTASLAGILILGAMQLETLAFFVLCGAFGAYFLNFPAGVLTGTWNPWITIIPLALYLFLMNGIANKRYLLIPLAALAGSFLIQTHVQYSLPVAASTLAGLVIAFLSDRLSGLNKRVIAVTACLLLLVWLPPIWEELHADRGNLSKLWAFSTEAAHNQSRDAGFQLAAASWSWLFTRGFEFFIKAPAASYAGLFVQAMLFLLGCWSAFRHKQQSLFTFCLITASATISAFIYANRIPGELAAHLILWIGVLGTCSLIPAGAAIAQKLPSVHWNAAGVVTIVALIVFGYFHLTQAPGTLEISMDRTKLIATASRSVASRLAQQPGKAAQISILSKRAWPAAAGVILQLYKSGSKICVHKDMTSTFGTQLQCPDGQPRRDILLGDAITYREFLDRPDFDALTDSAPLVAFASKRARQTEYPVYPRPVKLISISGVTGEPDVLFDGFIPPKTSVWYTPQFVALTSEQSFITLEVPSAQIRGIRFWSQSNDVYVIKGSGKGDNFFEIGRSGERFFDEPAAERIIYSDRISRCKYLQVSAKDGDGLYGIAEIQLLKAFD